MWHIIENKILSDEEYQDAREREMWEKLVGPLIYAFIVFIPFVIYAEDWLKNNSSWFIFVLVIFAYVRTGLIQSLAGFVIIFGSIWFVIKTYFLG